jgi:hypothetical protein
MDMRGLLDRVDAADGRRAGRGFCRRGANVLSDVRNLGTGNVRENQIVLMQPSEKTGESGPRRRLQARPEGRNG